MPGSLDDVSVRALANVDAPVVARVITRLNIGGPAIQAMRLSAALAARGFNTTLLHGRLGADEGDMRYLLSPDAQVTHITALQRPIAPMDDIRALIAIYRHLRRIRPAIVHTHMAKAGMLGRLAAASYNLTRGHVPRAKVVHTYHGHVLEGYFSPLVGRLFLTLERMLAPLTDFLIAISPTIQLELRDTLGIGRPAQYRVIPLGFDLARFASIDDAARAASRLALNLTPDALVVTTVGRLTAIKQPALFVDTVKRLVPRHPTLSAIVVGDGELRGDLEQAVDAAGLAATVRFLGWRRDLDTIYAASDVFLLTSRNEGTPVALIEAMASAVPGVSTDVGGVKDVIDSTAVGLLAATNDVDALSRHVSTLLSNAALRRDMGARARAHVLPRYDIARLVDDIATLYQDLLARR